MREARLRWSQQFCRQPKTTPLQEKRGVGGGGEKGRHAEWRIRSLIGSRNEWKSRTQKIDPNRWDNG